MVLRPLVGAAPTQPRLRTARPQPGDWDLVPPRRRTRDVRILVLLVAVLASLAAPASAWTAPFLLALQGDGTRSSLVQLDPATLAPADASRVPLGLHDLPWALSPDGTMLALGSGRTGSLLLVDVVGMRRLAQIPGHALALSWPDQAGLLAVTTEPDGGTFRQELVTYQPPSAQATMREPLAGRVYAAAPLPDGLALLTGPQFGTRIGPALLVLARPGRQPETIPLPGVSVGSKLRFGTIRHDWTRQPGLAVDPTGERAWIATRRSIVEVDLRTARTTRHPIAIDRRGLADGGPSLSHGYARQLLALDNGQLALSGSNTRTRRTSPGRYRQLPDRPLGLHLLDPTTWRSRQLDPNASGFLATGSLLVRQWYLPDGRKPGASLVRLRTWSSTGRRLTDLGLPGVSELQLAAGRAYAVLGHNPYRRHPVTILDLRNGKRLVTATVPGWTFILDPDQPTSCWCATGTG